MSQEGTSQSPNGHGLSSPSTPTSTEPVRSRWSPKPEQILILESIFNSGIVNPPREETVRIRKMLEKFGAVGDANVFYWFQNRRSRSRRRQRQLQAAASSNSGGAENNQQMRTLSMHHQYGGVSETIDLGFGSSGNLPSANYFFNESSPQVSSFLSSDGFESNNGMVESLYTMYDHESNHNQQISNIAASSLNTCHQNSNFQYQQELMTVFINGVPTEVTKGAIDVKAMFGEDLVLLHCSGLPLPTDEFGFLMHSLQHGQTYFLVPRQT